MGWSEILFHDPVEWTSCHFFESGLGVPLSNSFNPLRIWEGRSFLFMNRSYLSKLLLWGGVRYYSRSSGVDVLPFFREWFREGLRGI
jgi:hypothetical protein